MLTPTRALDDWLDDLERRDYSANTIREYGRYLGLLCDTLPRDIDVSKITLDDHIAPFLRRYRNRKRTTKSTAEAAICSMFGWLYFQRKISRNPTEFLVRTRRPAAEDLDVTTVSTDDVRRMLVLAKGWPEKLAMNVAVYLGPRRHAISELRISDYDRGRGRIRFQEKGATTIWKLIPEKLDMLIEQAIADGVYETQDYLVPSLRPEWVRKASRDDAVIWVLVKRVAERAKVNAHVHALRAAFACFYLELNPGNTVGLKEAMGHKRLATTEIYLRKMDKEKAMEPLRTLSWDVADLDSSLAAEVRSLRENLLSETEEPSVRAANDRLTRSLAAKRLGANAQDEGSSG